MSETDSKPFIYVFCNQKCCDGSGDWHSMIGIAEDGACLSGHVCSSHGWAFHDMGIDENGWKRDLYAKHYPDGFQVKWIEVEELQAVLKTLPPPPNMATNDTPEHLASNEEADV